MAFVTVMQLSQLKDQGRVTKIVNEKKVLLIWHNNKVHAVQAQCPHLKLPLTKAKINENDEITCPFHKSKFDLCTGEVKCWSTWPPVIGSLLGKVSKQKNLQVYKTKIKDEMVMVNI
jgi:nitrite reductase/ring-hydroxylating ferredoxin subunit